MSESFPIDDLTPPPTTLDCLLRMQLEAKANQVFFVRCDRVTQALLSRCQWSINTAAEVLTLAITCPDIETYWYLTSALPQLARYLEPIANTARIAINHPDATLSQVVIG